METQWPVPGGPGGGRQGSDWESVPTPAPARRRRAGPAAGRRSAAAAPPPPPLPAVTAVTVEISHAVTVAGDKSISHWHAVTVAGDACDQYPATPILSLRIRLGPGMTVRLSPGAAPAAGPGSPAEPPP
jgi:hypothetical protein